MDTPLSVLQHYWQHTSFRPVQEEIIASVLAKKDTLALLPTGGGKSICFQVPAMLMDGLCIVISPLIALMQDQVMNLQQKEIAAVALHSGLAQAEVSEILHACANGKYKFLYVSPERLESRLFREYLPDLPVALIVVDEAHCISQWGYDFRPPYLRIAALREVLDDVPVIALTASATPVVQDDIIAKLQMLQAAVFRQSFERPNLSYSVFRVDSKINKLVEVLNNVPGTGIVYCSSRRQTKELSHTLQRHQLSADYYHAGLTAEERAQKQEQWIRGETRVMVCTNAFGMGIDKPDVRTVVHMDIPDCLENYYQEAGRAGRDGKKAFAVLLYQWDDRENLLTLPDKKFPPIPQIRFIYQSIADFLHVAVGNGEGIYYDFDLAEFVRSFRIDMIQAVNTLKVLEQEGHIAFTENIFLPTQVQVVAARDVLDNIQQNHAPLDLVLKCLLRTYEGILDNPVSVHEKQLARLCRLEEPALIQRLQQLEAYGVIHYRPRKNTPQLTYLLNRAPAQYLLIDQDRYLERKRLYTGRLNHMLAYVDAGEGCRSRMIANYFGDQEVSDCHICDHCLALKRKGMSEEEVTLLRTAIQDAAVEQLTVPALIDRLKRYSREKIWTVLGYMTEEGLIKVDEEQVLRR